MTTPLHPPPPAPPPESPGAGTGAGTDTDQATTAEEDPTLRLMAQVLGTLAELDQGQGVALTRVAKRLGLRVSVLLRTCTQLSDAVLGGQAGPGWVKLDCRDGQWKAWLTPAGRGGAESADGQR